MPIPLWRMFTALLVRTFDALSINLYSRINDMDRKVQELGAKIDQLGLTITEHHMEIVRQHQEIVDAVRDGVPTEMLDGMIEKVSTGIERLQTFNLLQFTDGDRGEGGGETPEGGTPGEGEDEGSL